MIWSKLWRVSPTKFTVFISVVLRFQSSRLRFMVLLQLSPVGLLQPCIESNNLFPSVLYLLSHYRPTSWFTRQIQGFTGFSWKADFKDNAVKLCLAKSPKQTLVLFRVSLVIDCSSCFMIIRCWIMSWLVFEWHFTCQYANVKVAISSVFEHLFTFYLILLREGFISLIFTADVRWPWNRSWKS